MRIEAILKKYPGPEARGSITWDSETGELGGTLAAEIEKAAHKADARGWVPAGPEFSFEYRVKDALHSPAEFAAVLYHLGYDELPAELAASFNLPAPENTDPDDDQFRRVEELPPLRESDAENLRQRGVRVSQRRRIY